MNNVILNIFINVVILIPLIYICEKEKQYYVKLYIIITVVTNIIRVITGRLFNFDLIMNWEGKILAFIASIVFVIITTKGLYGIKSEDYKVAFGNYQNIKALIILNISLILLISITTVFIFSGWVQSFSIEQLLFQATIPGLDEELYFRGVGIGLLNLAFSKRIKVLGIEFGIGLIVVTIQFGLGHAMFLDPEIGMSFNLFMIVYTGLIGFILGLLAESTKSLMLPIITHNSYNVIITLISMFR